jgi:hypothetical protein
MLVSKINKLPRPTGKKNSKTTTSVAPVSATPDSLKQQTDKSNGLVPLEEQKKISEMLTLANLEFANVKNGIVKARKKELEVLDSTIKEFMGPLILIGYDLNDDPIEMVSASTQSEHDALVERLRRVNNRVTQNLINSGGTDPYGVHSN